MPPVANRSRLFAASCIALIVTAMSFAIRGDIKGSLSEQFGLSAEQLGLIDRPAFWGFTLAMVIGGPLCDVIGMKRLVWIAFVGHLVGILLTIFATSFWTFFVGALVIGIANGCVEAACNPLIATVFPDHKTKKLNQFHVWFPGGIVIGGLAAFAITRLGVGGDAAWQIKLGVMLLPLALYGYLFLGQKFPVTERVASGVSTSQMFSNCLRPLFILMILCMFLTASTELGPQQWMPYILSFTTGVSGSGILYLVWITGLMALGRQFAGPVVHRLSPSGMLLASAILSVAGLYLLSQASGAAAAFIAATVFAFGVCYFWPTMLGFVAERLPKTGALGLSLMGGAGMLAAGYFQPIMGGNFDENLNSAIPAQYSEPILSQAGPDATEAEVNQLWTEVHDSLVAAPEGSPEHEAWREAQAEAGAATLGTVVVLPAILIVVFGAIYVTDRAKGGYKAEKLGTADADAGGSSPNDVPRTDGEA